MLLADNTLFHGTLDVLTLKALVIGHKGRSRGKRPSERTWD
jgi:hypothetical protein